MSKTNSNRFKSEKTNRLTIKADLSIKGSIDEPMVELISVLNQCRTYYTTSSCSGRITLLADNSYSNAKTSVKWIYISHDLVQFDDLMSALKSADTPLFASFKLEPMVLHVCCDGLTSAKRLLSVAIGCGFRNSGLSISKSNRIIVAVRNTQSLEVPIIKDSELLVSEHYLKYIIEIANKKLSQNFDKINKFYSGVKSLCDNINNDLSIE